MHPTTAPRPRVSVVIPTYHAERTLGGAITGALTQTYPDVEVVVVDDGSTDRTAAIAHAYGDALTVLTQPNGGTAAARNAGAAAATGDLFVFCDADDVLLPTAVAEMVGAWQAAGGGRRAVTANSYALTEEGINPRRSLVMWTFPPPAKQRLALLQGNFAAALALYPRSLFDELGGYDPGLRVIEDWELWLRTAFAGAEIVFVRAPVGLYRWTPGSLADDSGRMIAGEEELLRDLARDRRDDLRPAERAYLQRRLASPSPRLLRRDADAALRTGDIARARHLYAQSAALLGSDAKLVRKARLLQAVPGAARLARARLLRIDRATGRTDTR